MEVLLCHASQASSSEYPQRETETGNIKLQTLEIHFPKFINWMWRLYWCRVVRTNCCWRCSLSSRPAAGNNAAACAPDDGNPTSSCCSRLPRCSFLLRNLPPFPPWPPPSPTRPSTPGAASPVAESWTASVVARGSIQTLAAARLTGALREAPRGCSWMAWSWMAGWMGRKGQTAVEGSLGSAMRRLVRRCIPHWDMKKMMGEARAPRECSLCSWTFSSVVQRSWDLLPPFTYVWGR